MTKKEMKKFYLAKVFKDTKKIKSGTIFDRLGTGPQDYGDDLFRTVVYGRMEYDSYMSSQWPDVLSELMGEGIIKHEELKNGDKVYWRVK